MASRSDIELSHSITASNDHLTIGAQEPFGSNLSVQKLREGWTGPDDIEPEYATGIRLTIIIVTICFSTFLTALDLVGSLPYRLR